MKKLLFISLVLLLGSCVTSQKLGTNVATAWEGNSKTNLIQQLGPPTKIVSDEAGGNIYIYELASPTQTPGNIYSNHNNISYTTPQTKRGTMMFYVNKGGTIYHGLYRDY
jgi:hypothetical protein